MSETLDLVIRAPRALISGEGEVARAIGVRDGRIAAISPLDTALTANETIELDSDVVLMPGLVDTHVHVNEPGHTDWEGFESATAAAAAGGITTLIDMPLNSIPVTVDVDALEIKKQAAKGKCQVDVGFLGGLIPTNLDQLRPLHDAGVFGFKCFLADSGLPEFPHVNSATMQEAMAVVSGLEVPLFVHAENALAAKSLPPLHSRRYADYLASRPCGYENLAIAQVIETARLTGAHAHICHLSSSDALAMIESARRDGVFITVETCPHYLSLRGEDISDGATYFKCCPPIRETPNRELLWGGLRANIIDLVVSDHSPSTPDLKTLGNGDLGSAWGGIASLQLTLAGGLDRGTFERLLTCQRGAVDVDRPAGGWWLKNKGRIALGTRRRLLCPCSRGDVRRGPGQAPATQLRYALRGSKALWRRPHHDLGWPAGRLFRRQGQVACAGSA